MEKDEIENKIKDFRKFIEKTVEDYLEHLKQDRAKPKLN